MLKLRPYPKRNILPMLLVWLLATTTQAQMNDTSPRYSFGIGYSRLPLESMEEYALDFWYAPISLLASYEPKPTARFTLSLGFGSEKAITHRDITEVSQQAVLGLGALRLWSRERFTPYIGVRAGFVQRRIRVSDSSLGRTDGDSYFVQAVAGGEVAISNQLRVGLEMAYQYASPKFWWRGEHAAVIRSYPTVGFEFGPNILVNYFLPW